MSDYKAGDQLVLKHRYGDWQIITVGRVTPSGRLVCGNYTLNPDLTVRGRGDWSAVYRAEPVTPEIRTEVLRQRNRRLLVHTKFDELDPRTLARLARIVREAKFDG